MRNQVLINGVSVVHWNPRRGIGSSRVGQRMTVGAKCNNFGDLLGPLIVALMVGKGRAVRRRRLLTIGSILHYARTGDAIWGTGLNGKVPADKHEFHSLDVRAVRGPMTRTFLQTHGVQAPGIYGDPALLLPTLRPDLVRKAAEPKRYDYLIVPNLNDAGDASLGSFQNVLNPTSPIEECLSAIVRSRLVVSSSLHGIIVAEAFNIPAIVVKPKKENSFKYDDYFQGTGRSQYGVARTFTEGLKSGKQTPSLDWDSTPLISAFPHDLWQANSL